MAVNPILDNEPRIVKTDEGATNGQDKCPKCGSTDISVNAKTGRLRCNFCRHEFEPEKNVGLETDVSKIEGEIMGSGTKDIVEDARRKCCNFKMYKLWSRSCNRHKRSRSGKMSLV